MSYGWNDVADPGQKTWDNRDPLSQNLPDWMGTAFDRMTNPGGRLLSGDSSWWDGPGGFGKKPNNTQTVTTTNEPWAGLQPHLLNYYGGVADWYNSGANQTATVSPETQSAWDMMGQRANGSPLDWAAQKASGDMINGNGFNDSFNSQFNPQAQRLGQQFNDVVMPGVSSKFIASGRTGSGAEQGAYKQAAGSLGDTLSSLASDIYGNERKNQFSAITSAPGLAEQDYANIGLLGQVGAGKQGYQQDLLNAPLKRLSEWGGMLQPGLGYTSGSQNSPLYQNHAGNIAGGAIVGNQIGNQYGYGGYGALGGALLGSLMNK